MTDAKHDNLREVMAGAGEVPDELRRRFDEQVEGILARRIGSVGRIVRVVGAIVGSAAGLYCAGWLLFWASLIIGGGHLFIEIVTYTMPLAAVLVLAATGVFHCVYDLKRGIVAPRKVQRVSFAIRYVCAFLIGFFIPMMALGWHRPGEESIGLWIACLIAFFWWSVAVALALYRITRWNYEDVMLEVKRTQLQIALLVERLAGKTEAK